jgi:probable rRNA maturation factor
MKKHQFLNFELNITIRLSSGEKRLILKWLDLTSFVLEKFFQEKFPRINKDLKNFQLSLLICGDKKIQTLNRDFRSLNKITDVLSFPNYENLRKNHKSLIFNEELFLGDLAICYPQTKRQAKKFQISDHEEFIHLFFHGFLHLLGFDHELSRKEELLMQELEDWCLNELSRLKSRMN